MKLLDKLFKIDRRIIFLIIGAIVIAGYFIPARLPISYTDPVENIYDFIESQPEGTCILVSFDYTPDTKPELYPMTCAFLRHCFRKKLKVIAIALWMPGAVLAEAALTSTAEEFGAKPGIDYVNLGYKPGVIAVILGIGENITEIFPQAKDIPIFKKVKNYNDIALVITFAAGMSPDWWVIYGYTRYKQKLAAGVTAVMAADYYPYLNTGQLIGLINGLKGAAEYENLVGKPGKATRGMNPQSAVHLAIIFFIIMGNIGYFMMLRKKKE